MKKGMLFLNVLIYVGIALYFLSLLIVVCSIKLDTKNFSASFTEQASSVSGDN